MSICDVTFNLLEDSAEAYGIVGNCCKLGSWDVKNAIILKSSKNGQHSVTLKLEAGQEVKYRYFHARIIKQEISVISWESTTKARKLTVPEKDEFVVDDGRYGHNDVKKNCTPGWLIGQSEFRLYISSCDTRPLLTKTTLDISNLQFKVKGSKHVTSSKLIKLVPYQSEILPSSTVLQVPNDDTVHLSYVFEYPARSCMGVTIFLSQNDEKIGKVQLRTTSLNKTKQNISLPVQDDNGVTIAEMNVSYLMLHPFQHSKMNVRDSENCWNRNNMLLVGHRGCGNSFTSKSLSNYRENSMESFRKVSNKNGRAFVEFDVHLSKDLVPIIYHDMTTCLETVKRDGEIGLTEVPVYHLTLDELQTFKTKHRSRKSNRRTLEFDENDYKTNPPFPTLCSVFEEIPYYTGFNIELKYPTLNKHGRFEDGLSNYIDPNLFVDSVLEVVYDKADEREIIFSSFDVDICILARRKQSKYPVFLLTNGDTEFYCKMMDLRERYNSMAIATATAEGFLGIDSLEEDLYKTPEIVEKTHEAGLLIAFYGDNVANNLELFDEKGVDVAIYDRIHAIDYEPKDREKQKKQKKTTIKEETTTKEE